MTRKSILILALTSVVLASTLTARAQQQDAPERIYTSQAIVDRLVGELDRLTKLAEETGERENSYSPAAFLLIRGLHAESTPLSTKEVEAMKLPRVFPQKFGTTRSCAEVRPGLRTSVFTLRFQDKSGSYSVRVAELLRQQPDGTWDAAAEGRTAVR